MPDEQQQKQTITVEGLAALYQDLGSSRHEIHETRAQKTALEAELAKRDERISALEADLTRHKELLNTALEQYGPKDGGQPLLQSSGED